MYVYVFSRCRRRGEFQNVLIGGSAARESQDVFVTEVTGQLYSHTCSNYRKPCKIAILVQKAQTRANWGNKRKLCSGHSKMISHFII